METWKLLLIVFLSAIVLGSVVGLIIGKVQVKMMRSRGSLVSRKELLVLMAVLLVGVGCVLFGVFYSSGGGEADPVNNPGDMMNPDGVVTGKGEALSGDGDKLLYSDDKADDIPEGDLNDGDLTDEDGGEESGVDGEDASDDNADEPTTTAGGVKSSGGTGVVVAENAGGSGRVAIARRVG